MKTTFSILAIGAAAFAAAGSSHETFDYSAGPTSKTNYSFDLQGFNSHLGTLTSVDFTLSGASAQEFLTVYGSKKLAGDKWSFDVTDTFAVSIDGHVLASVSGSGKAKGEVEKTDKTYEIDATYTGKGVTVDLKSKSLLKDFTVNGNKDVSLKLATGGDFDFSGSCDVRDALSTKNILANGHVTYNYTAAVPEPAPLAALGLGLIGVLRRKRK